MLSIFFDKIKPSVICSKLEKICISEEIDYNKHQLDLISEKSDGDLRKAITTLQTYYYLNKKVSNYLFSTENDDSQLINEFVKISCCGEHHDILKFNRNIISRGYNIKEIIIYLNNFTISNSEINNCLKEKVIYNLSTIYRYISFGSDELIQLIFLSYIFINYLIPN